MRHFATALLVGAFQDELQKGGQSSAETDDDIASPVVLDLGVRSDNTVKGLHVEFHFAGKIYLEADKVLILGDYRCLI